ncbi:MAG: hypothetical protein A2167_05810 [Planctomycetes bacterium RBG_13_46_10]|nr:MAG: hypothetical protein A2167_05810 [Planctomycetes bacterium RBG_13_46_10]
MVDENIGKIWKVRTIKNYPEAHNHILVGKVLEITDSFIRMHCRTYHFGRAINGPKDIQIGSVMVRVVPWGRIEIINELPQNFNYTRGDLIADKEGQVLFQNEQLACPLVSYSERRY